MSKKIRLVVFFSFVLVFLFASTQTLTAIASTSFTQSNTGYLFCSGAGWSNWIPLQIASGNTRTIYFYPNRAGHHQLQFHSTSGYIIKLVPHWSSNTGSGSWGPYYSIYGNTQTILLETGDSSVKYTFDASETRGLWTTVYFRNYCSATY
jgi:hypothetical protein